MLSGENLEFGFQLRINSLKNRAVKLTDFKNEGNFRELQYTVHLVATASDRRVALAPTARYFYWWYRPLAITVKLRQLLRCRQRYCANTVLCHVMWPTIHNRAKKVNSTMTNQNSLILFPMKDFFQKFSKYLTVSLVSRGEHVYKS